MCQYSVVASATTAVLLLQETNGPADSFLYGECIFTTPDNGSMALTNVRGQHAFLCPCPTRMILPDSDVHLVASNRQHLRCDSYSSAWVCCCRRTKHRSAVPAQKVFEAATSPNGINSRPVRTKTVRL